MSLYSDEYLADENPDSLRQIVLEQGRDIAALKQALLEFEQLSNIAKDGGELGSLSLPTLMADGDGAYTDANLFAIKWILPLNLSDDDVTYIKAMAYDGSEWVYVGGLFERIGGVEAANIARYSLITRQWEEVNGGVNSYVNTIAIRPSDGVVFIGGNFTDAGGAATADYLAYDNAGTWAVVVASLNNAVEKLFFDTNDDLYVGGSFSNAGGNANADSIFKWAGSVSALGTGIASTPVSAINIDASGNVWAGGAFTGKLSKWNGSTWTQPFTITDGEVRSIEFDAAGVMYVGGSFTEVNSDSSLAYLFKSSDGSTASAVGEVLNNPVLAIDVDNDDNVYVGGAFTDAGGVSEADRIAKWNGTYWEALSNGGGASGLDNSVYAMLRLDSGSIIVGGSFNFAGSLQCQSIAIFCFPLSEAIDVIASLFELYASRTAITHDTANITTANITDATITDATITDATITDLDAATLNGKNIWKPIYKDAPENRASTTTLANDSELVFNFGTSLGKYAIRGRIFFDTAATPDFKFRLGGSATITPARVFVKYVVPGTTTLVTAIETAIPFATTYALVGTGTTGGYIEFDGEFEVTVTGTIALQWAQNTSNGSNTTVLAGSYFELLKVG